MKRMRKLILLVIPFALVLSACTIQSTPTVTIAATPMVVQAQAVSGTPVPPGEFDAARAFEQNRKLAVDIGKRVAGTAGGQSAADYIASQFSQDGLTVTRQPFPFEAWEDRGTTVQITAPRSATLEAEPIQYSPGGKANAPVVVVGGLGARDDFAKVSVKDKIALVKRGGLTFGSIATNAQQAGAAAVLVYNNAPPVFSGTMRERVNIPTIGLSGTAGQTILDQLKNGDVQVSVSSDSGVSQKTGNNVIGVLRGASDDTIVLGGHYDTVPAGPGADDNGSGTATLLELARVIGQRKTPPQHTLVFIAFDAEELGLLGSRAYVNSLSGDQLQKIGAMLNFDMLGAGSGPLLVIGDGSVALLARSSAQQLGIDAHVGQLPANAGSDHESFASRGVDTVFFMRNYQLLHTPQDKIDQVKPEYLGEAGRVGLSVLDRLDTTPRPKQSSPNAPAQ